MSRRRYSRKRGRAKRITAIATSAVALLLILTQLLLGYLGLDYNDLLDYVWQPSVAAYMPVEGTAEVHFIDVGQASSILIIGSDKTALIDAGESSTSNEVIDYLRGYSVDKIDYFFGTHPHSDHMGGCRQVMQAIPTAEFITSQLDPQSTPTTNYYSKLIDYLASNTDTITSSVAEVGGSYDLGGGLILTVLAPTELYKDINNSSLVIRMDFGKTSFLFTGDIEDSSEQDMVAAGVLDVVTVLSSPHHGSETSIDRDFMRRIAPQYAVISCGEGNDYGHPHSETLDLYTKMGIQYYRTDYHGSVKLVTDGNELTVSTERS